MVRLEFVARAPTPDVETRGLGLLSTLRRRRALRLERKLADDELRSSVDTSPRTAWRARELTSERSRRTLARSIDKILRYADGRYLPGASPLNRLAVREHSAALRGLAARLRDLERPVAARGVLLIDDLLSDGCGPLYVSYRVNELREAVVRAADALERASVSVRSSVRDHTDDAPHDGMDASMNCDAIGDSA